MIQYCLEKWDKNCKNLENIIRQDALINECEYDYLVNLVVIHILNDGEDISKKSDMDIFDLLKTREADNKYLWDNGKISMINDGTWQGTLLFLIPRNEGGGYPAEYDYLMTYVDYGSCSGCDTLQGIQLQALDYFYQKNRDNTSQCPIERQVKEYMMLCKDIVSNMIRPYNHGWRNEERFEQVEVDVMKEE